MTMGQILMKILLLKIFSLIFPNSFDRFLKIRKLFQFNVIKMSLKYSNIFRFSIFNLSKISDVILFDMKRHIEMKKGFLHKKNPIYFLSDLKIN